MLQIQAEPPFTQIKILVEDYQDSMLKLQEIFIKWIIVFIVELELVESIKLVLHPLIFKAGNILIIKIIRTNLPLIFILLITLGTLFLKCKIKLSKNSKEIYSL